MYHVEVTIWNVARHGMHTCHSSTQKAEAGGHEFKDRLNNRHTRIMKRIMPAKYLVFSKCGLVPIHISSK